MSTPQRYALDDPCANSSAAEVSVHQPLMLDSTPTVRQYFEKVLELKKTGVAFPVQLDDVWSLCYERKDVAVRVLQSEFVEHIDYQVLRKSLEKSKGRPKDYYSLTVECLEWFVARKVREVFEVYREVFHRVAAIATQYTSTQEAGLVELVNTLTDKIIGLEGKIDRMHKARTKYFKAVVVDRKKRKQERKDDQLQSGFDEWREKFWRSLRSYVVSCHNVHTPDRVEEMIRKKAKNDYGIDPDHYLRFRSPGEHIFETLYRHGYGRQLYFILTCQLQFSYLIQK